MRAGLRLILEKPDRLLDGGLRIEDVILEAESSNATFYRKFSTKSRYLAEVLNSLIAGESPTPADIGATVQAALDTAGGDRIRAVRALIVDHFDMAVAERAVTRRLLAIALSATAKQSAREVSTTYQQTDQLILQIFDVLFARSGATLRRPFTAQSFSVVITALVEGFVIRHRAQPRAVSAQLVADTVLAVVHVAVDSSQRHAHIEDILAESGPATDPISPLPSEPRAALLTAAREHFTKRGYFMSDLDSIAREARVPTEVARRIFPTKTQLIIAALKTPYAALAQEISDDSVVGYDTVDIIRRHFTRFARLVADQRAFMDALMAAVAHDTYLEPDGLISIRRELDFPRLLVPLIEKARDSGQLAGDQPAFDIAALLTNTLLLRCFTRREETPEHNADFVATIVLGGLLSR